jgi:hypothetical protein
MDEFRPIQRILSDPLIPDEIKDGIRRSLRVTVICANVDIHNWRAEQRRMNEAAAELHRNFDWGWR